MWNHIRNYQYHPKLYTWGPNFSSHLHLSWIDTIYSYFTMYQCKGDFGFNLRIKGKHRQEKKMKLDRKQH